jgi:hypothetical protein
MPLLPYVFAWIEVGICAILGPLAIPVIGQMAKNGNFGRKSVKIISNFNTSIHVIFQCFL